MSEDHVVSFSLEINVEEAYAEVRRLQTVLNRTLGIVSRLTGDENIKEAIRAMQAAIRVANQLRLALASLQALRMAAGDPLAWAMTGIATVSVIVGVVDEMEARMPEY